MRETEETCGKMGETRTDGTEEIVSYLALWQGSVKKAVPTKD